MRRQAILADARHRRFVLGLLQAALNHEPAEQSLQINTLCLSHIPDTSTQTVQDSHFDNQHQVLSQSHTCKIEIVQAAILLPRGLIELSLQ